MYPIAKHTQPVLRPLHAAVRRIIERRAIDVFHLNVVALRRSFGRITSESSLSVSCLSPYALCIHHGLTTYACSQPQRRLPHGEQSTFRRQLSATSEFISSAPATTHTSTPSSTSASPVAPVAAVTKTETASTTPESPSVASASL